MKKRKLKKKPIIVFVISILIIIFLLMWIIKTINYHNSYEYKMKKLGYNEQEVNYLIKKFKNKTLDYILTIDYDKNVYKLAKQTYFIENNLKQYLKYSKDNNKKVKDIIAIINVNSNNEWYTKYTDSDISKDNLVLVNKFNKLDKNYEPKDLVNVSSVYSFGSNQKLRQEAFYAFKNMFEDAKKENLTLIINSSYRSYKEQEEIYNEYYQRYGMDYADSIAAKPGFSEHQTGLCIDVQTYNSSAKTFENFDEFKWLKENAHKYGFILRYPKDKEYITGYDYESWHYRYVGQKVASYIYKNDITYDEYYAYFVK